MTTLEIKEKINYYSQKTELTKRDAFNLLVLLCASFERLELLESDITELSRLLDL